MPSLNWTGKHHVTPAPASLIQDSILYPGGYGYPNAHPQSRLFFGNNLGVMSALLPEYDGRVNSGRGGAVLWRTICGHQWRDWLYFGSVPDCA